MALKVERQSLTDQIVEELRKRIVAGEFAEGLPLRQEALAKELGVSRIPVREAIKQLEAEGFVESVLHKGAVVRGLSIDELHELFEIRTRFETWLFAMSIPRLTAADFENADRLTDEMMIAGSVEDWGTRNWQFHETLLGASDRPVALKFLKTVHEKANRYVNLQIAVARDNERELADHRTLLAYARLRDVERAVGMMRAHIQRVSTNLIASLRRASDAEIARSA